MLSYFLRPLRGAVSVFAANESPRQIAAGMALGAVLGMVPKGNLIAVVLLTLLFALRMNRTAGLLTAAAFSLVSLALDPFTHRLGARLLSIVSMQPTYAWLYDLPLGPWIGFHNTVVIGSLVVGLYIAYPVYLVSRIVLDRVHAPIARWLMRYRVARWLMGADLSSRFGIGTSMGAGS